MRKLQWVRVLKDRTRVGAGLGVRNEDWVGQINAKLAQRLLRVERVELLELEDAVGLLSSGVEEKPDRRRLEREDRLQRQAEARALEAEANRPWEIGDECQLVGEPDSPVMTIYAVEAEDEIVSAVWRTDPGGSKQTRDFRFEQIQRPFEGDADADDAEEEDDDLAKPDDPAGGEGDADEPQKPEPEPTDNPEGGGASPAAEVATETTKETTETTTVETTEEFELNVGDHCQHKDGEGPVMTVASIGVDGVVYTTWPAFEGSEEEVERGEFPADDLRPIEGAIPKQEDADERTTEDEREG